MTTDHSDTVIADCAAILVAAGTGTRAGKHDGTVAGTKAGAGIGLAKQFWQLADKPVLAHSIDVLMAHPRISCLVIVVSPENLADIDKRFGSKKCKVVIGGASRQLSVFAGLRALDEVFSTDTAPQKTPAAEFVAIHDAARPLLPQQLLDTMLARIDPTIAGVVPALSVSDTIIEAGPDDTAAKLLDRSPMRALQTPQLFRRALITNLHKQFQDDPRFTDDCGLAVAAGHKIAIVAGQKQLLKLTEREDYTILQAYHDLATAQPTMTGPDMPDIRVGNGFDVHKFADTPGPIMLAGISIESDRGMMAHSDGDVGLHALCDAIFGALADGDIGHHFPPSDPQWKAADSAQFLKFAVDRVQQRSGKILNLDLTFICETPKIGGMRDKMRARIAAITAVPVERIAVKATTSEKLGFTGRGEGIAAQATACIALPDTAANRPSTTAPTP